MEIITTIREMQAWAATCRVAGRSIGFVPTMGALHEGHGSLLEMSRRDNDASVLSIFVNPTQFNQQSDFETYPRTHEADFEMADRLGVTVVFAPGVDQMYPDGSVTQVHPGPLAEMLEGQHRPGHFEGVATVVLKLFNTVSPHRAYFGLKDFQQVAVVRSMVRDLNVAVDIVAAETVRASDGLALSSRNARLSPDDRRAATVIHKALEAGRDAHRSGVHRAADIRRMTWDLLEREPRCRVEYVEIVDVTNLRPVTSTDTPSVILVAAWIGDVRLIDNVQLPAIDA